MKLDAILKSLECALIRGSADTEISGIALDSRQVRSGYLFVACKGTDTDGHRFIDDAFSRGAAAVMVSNPSAAVPGSIPVIGFEQSVAFLAELADMFYGQPACMIVGITGTNGKTTSSYLVRYFLEQCGIPTGLISTVAYEFNSRSIPAARTTPDVFHVYRLLHQMVEKGAKAVVMEVSSHAMDQNRTGKVLFDCAMFTNLTQDHLDYHHTMDDYYSAKRKLFTMLKPVGPGEEHRRAVVSIDDEWGEKLAAELRDGAVPHYTYSITGKQAGIRASDIRVRQDGSEFVLMGFEPGDCMVNLNLLGRHNVANCVGSLLVARELGCPAGRLLQACRNTPAIPGRLEFIENRLGLVIVIDYAHTDDALANVLRCLHEITDRHIRVVFGCGGDRDRSKRPRMGAVAEELADYVILTDDNPRTEDSSRIIDDIRKGMKKGTEVVVPDRREAITAAIRSAAPGDVVLIAGKGHETYQEINRVFYDYDERVVTRGIVAELEKENVSA
jgi:UDP-N-acetylmuramoyl-L-alanyl-D-glutamate--2,6-diaminopimelate ligase